MANFAMQTQHTQCSVWFQHKCCLYCATYDFLKYLLKNFRIAKFILLIPYSVVLYNSYILIYRNLAAHLQRTLFLIQTYSIPFLTFFYIMLCSPFVKIDLSPNIKKECTKLNFFRLFFIKLAFRKYFRDFDFKIFNPMFLQNCIYLNVQYFVNLLLV